jgi:hypothetical protein
MKTLIILASTVGNWWEANEYFVDAQTLWRIEKRWHAEGDNISVDGYLEEIKIELDELDKVLADEEPEDSDHETTVDDISIFHDESIADTQGTIDDLGVDDRLDPGRQAHVDSPAMLSIMYPTPITSPEHRAASDSITGKEADTWSEGGQSNTYLDEDLSEILRGATES